MALSTQRKISALPLERTGQALHTLIEAFADAFLERDARRCGVVALLSNRSRVHKILTVERFRAADSPSIFSALEGILRWAKREGVAAKKILTRPVLSTISARNKMKRALAISSDSRMIQVDAEDLFGSILDFVLKLESRAGHHHRSAMPAQGAPGSRSR